MYIEHILYCVKICKNLPFVLTISSYQGLHPSSLVEDRAQHLILSGTNQQTTEK